jgi:phosphoglycerate dehydrogenase-like enzyme
MSNSVGVLVDSSISSVFGSDTSEVIQRELTRLLPSDVAIEAPRTLSESRERIPDAETVLTMRDVSDDLGEDPAVRWIQVGASGVDYWDLDALRGTGVVLTNASGVAANPISEQVLGYMLAFERRIHKGIRQQERDGVWRRYSAGELDGKTVGIIGVGAIGSRVAELASCFGMRVIGTKRTPETAPDTVDEIHPPAALDRVLREADYVVVACPLVDATRGLIGSAELRTMSGDAVLVNVARGEIVDESALTEAIQQRRIRGAALDVFESEPLPSDSVLWDLSDVIVTPHMAASTPRYGERICSLYADNYERYANDETSEMENRVL